MTWRGIYIGPDPTLRGERALLMRGDGCVKAQFDNLKFVVDGGLGVGWHPFPENYFLKTISTVETLFDDDSTRLKMTVMSKLEAMWDDSRNQTDKFWTEEL